MLVLMNISPPSKLIRGRTAFFEDESTLEHTFVPDRIEDREEVIEQISWDLSKLAAGVLPGYHFIFGVSGSGKTAVMKWMLKHWLLKDLGGEANEDTGFYHFKADGEDMNIVFIPCGDCSTKMRVIIRLVQLLKDSEYPSRGKSVDEAKDDLKASLKDKKLLVVLDEFQDMNPPDRNRTLRAISSIRGVALFVMSNVKYILDDMNPAVASRFRYRTIEFLPYNAIQLAAILNERVRLAFQPRVVGEDTVNYIASIAAKRGGDARHALNVLREAGNISFKQGGKKVTKTEADLAVDELEKKDVKKTMNEMPFHSQLIVGAFVMIEGIGLERYYTTDVYAVYNILAKNLGEPPVTIRWMNDIINRYAQMGMIKTDLPRGLGRGGGVVKKVKLKADLESLTRALRETSDISSVWEKSKEEARKVIKKPRPKRR